MTSITFDIQGISLSCGLPFFLYLSSLSAIFFVRNVTELKNIS